MSSVTAHRDWLIAQYTAKKGTYELLATAINQVATDQVQSYEIDTAQMRRRVVKTNLNEMRVVLNDLFRDIQQLAQQLGYTEDVISVVPDFG